MKNFSLLFLISFCFLLAVICGCGSSGGGDNPAPSSYWTKQFGTAADDIGYGAAIDSSGNIYVAGYTAGTFEGNTYAGEHDIFLAKYSSSGSRVWVKQIGTPAEDEAKAAAVDSNGNIYVTGYTMGSLEGQAHLGDRDIFLVKYTSSGTLEWTRQFGSVIPDWGWGVAVDSSNNIYVTGVGGVVDSLWKYNSSGDFQWKAQFPAANCVGYALAVDGNSNIFVTGSTTASLEGNINIGGADVFIIKYSSSGSREAVKQFGTTADDYGQGIAIYGTDHIYVAGYTYGTFEGNAYAGSTDIFVTKYNSSFTKQWVKQIGTSAAENGCGIAMDATGSNTYVGGYTAGNLEGNTNAGIYDIFGTSYDSSGTKQWLKLAGTTSYDGGQAVCRDSNNYLYIAGATEGSIDGNANAGNKDVCIVKYNSSGTKQ